MCALKNDWGSGKVWMLIAASAFVGCLVLFLYVSSWVSRERMKSNESFAVSFCRKVARAQELYNTRHKTYVNPEHLFKTGYLKESLQDNEKNGYSFSFEFKNDSKDWTLIAEPLEPDVTGRRVFRITSDGVIYTAKAADASYSPDDGPVLRVDSKKLSRTEISSHMEAPLTSGNNILYCSTFQIAWNELKSLLGGDVKLKDAPPMVRFLNNSLSTKDDIAESDYLAMVGLAGKGILQKVNLALKEKFNGEISPIEVTFQQADDILAFAFLFKNLTFKKHFETLSKPVYFASNTGSARTKAFGISEYSHENGHHLKMAKQIKVVDYKNDNNFIITLKPSQPQDEIVLAKMEPRETLLATLKSVMSRIATEESECLGDGDTLQIPKLNFDVRHSYDELLGKDSLNKGHKHQFIMIALQMIRFRLNERGALLKSYAWIVPSSNGGDTEHEHQPKKLIFDRPFLIYLKEKGAKYPYFALWVDNPELLVKQ